MGAPRGPLGFQSVTVSTSAIGITTAPGSNNGVTPSAAVITVEDAPVRVRVDGTDPTSSVGHIFEVGDTIILTSSDELQKFKAIRKDGTNATLRVTRYVEYMA